MSKIGAPLFNREHPFPFVLNVAGPRESKAGGIQKRTKTFLIDVFAGLGIIPDEA